MTQPTHGEIQRDMGRMEGKQDAMGARLDRLEKMIEEGFSELRNDIADLKSAESKRSGAFAIGHWIVGIIGAGVAILIDHLWK